MKILDDSARSSAVLADDAHSIRLELKNGQVFVMTESETALRVYSGRLALGIRPRAGNCVYLEELA